MARPAGLARLGLGLLPWFVPFDVERYLAAHFAKVGAQTRLMLGEWAALGRAHGLPVDSIRGAREGHQVMARRL